MNANKIDLERISMMRTAFNCLSVLAVMAQLACGQSPSEEASVNVAGKTLSIKYAAPSVRGRQIFGDSGVVSHDKTYPVWRAGANRATAFHTDADLNVGGSVVPAGDYTLFVLVKNPDEWQLILNKQTGQWGLTYKEDQDLARVRMDMSKPASPVETLKYTLTNEESNKVTLTLAWDDHVGSVHITLK
jgi:hypothetical protein